VIEATCCQHHGLLLDPARQVGKESVSGGARKFALGHYKLSLKILKSGI